MNKEDLIDTLGSAVAFADSPNDFDNDSREKLQVDLDTLYRQVRDGRLAIVPAPTPSEAAAAAKQNQHGATGQALEPATPMTEIEAMLPSFLETYGKACTEKSWEPFIALLLTMKAQAEKALPHVELEDGNLVEPDEGEGAEAPGMGC